MAAGADDFPWLDPKDPGFKPVRFDPKKDIAPEGAFDECDGTYPDGNEPSALG